MASSSIETNKVRLLNFKKTMLQSINDELSINNERYLINMKRNIDTQIKDKPDLSDEIKEFINDLFIKEIDHLNIKLHKDSDIIIKDKLMSYDNKLLHMMYDVKRHVDQTAETQLYDIINTDIKIKSNIKSNSKYNSLYNSYDITKYGDDEHVDDGNGIGIADDGDDGDVDGDGDGDGDDGDEINSNVNFNEFLSRFNLSNSDIECETHEINNDEIDSNVVSIEYMANDNDDFKLDSAILLREQELIQNNVIEIRQIAHDLGINIKDIESGKTKTKGTLIEEIIEHENEIEYM